MAFTDNWEGYWWLRFMEEGEETSQHLIIENLHAELEKEREASASATSEVLSMISRLQGEKAEQKMEVSQYKRLAEEKTRHTEELLAIFDELLHQKEEEMDSLKIQIRDYVDKLLNLVSDTSGYQTKNSENQLLNGFNSFMDDNDGNEFVKRNSLHPVSKTEGLYSQMDSMDETGGKLKQVILQECSGQKHGGPSIGHHDSLLRSYSFRFQQEEEIKEKTIDSLRNVDNPRVSISADSWNARERYKSSRTNLLVSDDMHNLDDEELENEDVGSFYQEIQDKQPNSSSDWDASSGSCLETASCRNNTSTNMHDIYEVPTEHHTLDKLPKTNLLKANMEDDQKPELTHFISKEAVDYSYNDDLTKTGIEWPFHEWGLHAPGKQIIPADLQHVWTQRVDCAPPWFDGKQYEMRLQKLEDSITTQHEDREEQMKLLREILKKFNTISSHIHEQRIKKQYHQDISPLFSLLEDAMLSLSI